MGGLAARPAKPVPLNTALVSKLTLPTQVQPSKTAPSRPAGGSDSGAVGSGSASADSGVGLKGHPAGPGGTPDVAQLEPGS